MIKEKSTWLKLSDNEKDYHYRQYKEAYRSTVHAMEFIKKFTGLNKKSKLRILDMGTGGGANLFWLSKMFPLCKFYGLDCNPELISFARKQNKGNTEIEFICGDFKTAKQLGKFDYVLSFQILSWLSFKSAEKFLKLNFTLADKGVFLSSLFSEYDLDYEIKLKDYYENKTVFYNVYSLPRIEKVVQKNGFYLKNAEQFKIDIDLSKGNKGKGTYTIKTEDNQRLQFSGSMYMPWYFLLLHRKEN